MPASVAACYAIGEVGSLGSSCFVAFSSNSVVLVCTCFSSAAENLSRTGWSRSGTTAPTIRSGSRVTDTGDVGDIDDDLLAAAQLGTGGDRLGELQAAQVTVGLAAVEEPRDGLLADVAALLEAHRALVEAGDELVEADVVLLLDLHEVAALGARLDDDTLSVLARLQAQRLTVRHVPEVEPSGLVRI